VAVVVVGFARSEETQACGRAGLQVIDQTVVEEGLQACSVRRASVRVRALYSSRTGRDMWRMHPVPVVGSQHPGAARRERGGS
jgi:hypothetical protein